MASVAAPFLHAWVDWGLPLVPPTFGTLLWEALYYYPWASLLLVFLSSLCMQCVTRRIHVLHTLLSLFFAALTRLWLSHLPHPGSF